MTYRVDTWTPPSDGVGGDIKSGESYHPNKKPVWNGTTRKTQDLQEALSRDSQLTAISAINRNQSARNARGRQLLIARTGQEDAAQYLPESRWSIKRADSGDGAMTRCFLPTHTNNCLHDFEPPRVHITHDMRPRQINSKKLTQTIHHLRKLTI